MFKHAFEYFLLLLYLITTTAAAAGGGLKGEEEEALETIDCLSDRQKRENEAMIVSGKSTARRGGDDGRGSHLCLFVLFFFFFLFPVPVRRHQTRHVPCLSCCCCSCRCIVCDIKWRNDELILFGLSLTSVCPCCKSTALLNKDHKGKESKSSAPIPK